jgi:hypothetical protein
MASFLEVAPLHSIAEVRRNGVMLPAERGLYGLFFRAVPGIAPVDGCFGREGMPLLYIGTAGADLAKGGTLRSRLGGNHLGGNERRSTVCLTLASLLPDIAGPSVARLERGKIKFHTSPEGVGRLRAWMDENVVACWASHPRPSDVEAELVHHYNTPLNIDFSSHPFVPTLSALRSKRRALATSRSEE